MLLTMSCTGRDDLVNSIGGQIFALPGDGRSCPVGTPIGLGRATHLGLAIRRPIRNNAVSFSYAPTPKERVTVRIRFLPSVGAQMSLKLVAGACRVAGRPLALVWVGPFGSIR